ncbi:MAG: hypothetical protein ACFCVE_01840 [Phycisphaerae bacterium]
MAFALVVLVVAVALVALAGLLGLLPRLGGPGRAAADALIRAPGLDLVVFTLTTLPPVAAAAVLGFTRPGGWAGVIGGAAAAMLGQGVALVVWSKLHELGHGKRSGINRTLSSIVGTVRNHLALWLTLVALPGFLIVRLAEWVVYPPLTWLVALPRYRHAEWVNVSRQKFEGLVGYDLIWCLYCDWMTGIWSLGTEMLRNVESFWCPIRFSDKTKCEKCVHEFPDVAEAWVPADGTMAQVEQTLHDRYPGPAGQNAWFGHPVRLTVHGKSASQNADIPRQPTPPTPPPTLPPTTRPTPVPRPDDNPK